VSFVPIPLRFVLPAMYLDCHSSPSFLLPSMLSDIHTINLCSVGFDYGFGGELRGMMAAGVRPGKARAE
jgi:hypothetical protein